VTPEQRRFLAQKLKAAAQAQPRLLELAKRLKAIGGEQLVAPRHGEADLDVLLELGVVFPGKGAQRKRGRVSDCHDNVARLFKRSPAVTRIVTGYALSSDGLWRQHSWALVKDRLVETTEPRLTYFGFVVPLKRAERWAARV
jgi:hypothetical protein